MVVDVRTVPRSRTNPQYNFDTLAELAPFQIGYERISELGGLRSRSTPAAQERDGLLVYPAPA